MRISESGGEMAIIKLIESAYGGKKDDRVVLGFGDDAALIRTGGDRLLIVTTDLLAENTHFRRTTIDAYSLGWKSVAVNISDIAAMGGLPTYAFASIAFPDVDMEYIEQLYRGMNDCSSRFGSAVIGGDTNRVHGDIVINVAQLGEVEQGRQALRSAAKPGDRIMVTGTLGDSLAGFKLLDSLGLDEAIAANARVVERHIRPVPRVPESRAAVEKGLVRGMMDLSDGLAIDLGKFCAASGVGARVSAASLPLSSDLVLAAGLIEADPIELAASGGEDYELLIAAAPEAADALAEVVKEATGTPVTDIGEFTESGETVFVALDGTEIELKPGWTHF